MKIYNSLIINRCRNKYIGLLITFTSLLFSVTIFNPKCLIKKKNYSDCKYTAHGTLLNASE